MSSLSDIASASLVLCVVVRGPGSVGSGPTGPSFGEAVRTGEGFWARAVAVRLRVGVGVGVGAAAAVREADGDGEAEGEGDAVADGDGDGVADGPVVRDSGTRSPGPAATAVVAGAEAAVSAVA
ncbi:hypothetical protein AB0E16_25605, partial [Streptomyces sp. NPDC047970]